jgi:hypothetical protein
MQCTAGRAIQLDRPYFLLTFGNLIGSSCAVTLVCIVVTRRDNAMAAKVCGESQVQ